jgi:GNAT superfamily N-acetyltransferase
MTMAMPTIRPLRAAEGEVALPALAAVLHDAVAHGASVNFMADFTLEDAAAFWRGQLPGLAEGTRHILVAETEDGRILGTVVVAFAAQPNQPHRADIGKMIVHSGARGRGTGQRLLEAAEALALDHGRTLLTLDTETGSAGERLYRRCGWTPLGAIPNYSFTPDGRLMPATFFYKELRTTHARHPAGRDG